MDEIILIGAGGHARSCIDVIEQEGCFAIAGLVENQSRDSEDILGYPIIGSDNDLPELRKRYTYALVTVGQLTSVAPRKRLYYRLKELGYSLPVIVSPRAYVSQHAEIGEGTIIMHDALLNAQATSGVDCIINTKALVEHDAAVGDHCHISTSAVVNGGVTIGSESFIGSGVVVKQSISVGEKCVIGAGCIIKTVVESHRVINNG